MSTDESESSLSFSLEDLPFDRFNEFLEELAAKGVSQQEVAKRLGVSAQYVTDIKARRRRISELFARRLEDQFHRSRGWFLGTEDDPNGALAPQRVEGRAARATCQCFRILLWETPSRIRNGTAPKSRFAVSRPLRPWLAAGRIYYGSASTTAKDGSAAMILSSSRRRPKTKPRFMFSNR